MPSPATPEWKSFTANDVGKLIPAIQSRLTLVCFDMFPTEREQVLQRVLARYRSKLAELGIKYDEATLDKIIGIYWPDFRKIAHQIEYEFI
jgi:hypothetical protein